jgi:hypothetical protein
MAADDWKHRTGTGPRPGRPTTAKKGKGVSRVAIAVFPLLVAGGVALGLLTWVRAEPAPLFLSIPVTEYEAWPANPWAQQDAEGLAAAFPEKAVRSIPTQSQSQPDGIEREIDKLAEEAKKNPGQPIVIHLNALAVADGDEVFVLLSKAPTDRGELWKPLDTVLKAVAGLKGDRLLVLDLRPVAEPRVGQMGNELANAVHNTLKARHEAKQLPYLVAAFCAPAEYPYVSPELGRGVFAEFLRLGLEGRADGFTGEVDNDVQAVELMTYARAWVVHWLRKHKAPIVAPVLYGTGNDFVLRRVPQTLSPWPEAKEAAAPPEELGAAWKAVDEWREDGAVHKYPRTFRQLQELVVRIDQASAGGGQWDQLGIRLGDRRKPIDVQRKILEPKSYPVMTVGRVEHRLKARPKDSGPPKAVEPKAEAKGPDFEAEMRKLLDALKFANRSAGTKAKPVDPKVSEEAAAALTKVQAAFVETPPEPPPYDRIVREMYEDLVKSDGTERSRETLEQYGKTLRDLRNPPGHVELAYLELVADPSPAERWQWPPALPRFLLAAARAGEEAVVVRGRGLLRMAQSEDVNSLGKADQEFAERLASVFTPDEVKWGAAARKFEELVGTYRNLGTLGAAHAAAVQEWEEGIALLVAVGDFAPATGSGGDDAFEKKWMNLRDRVRDLRAAIDRQDAASELAVATDEARRAREKDFEPELRPQSTGDPIETRARLRLPLWTDQERKDWTAAANKAALALATEALAEQGVKPDGDVRTPVKTEAFEQAADRRAKRALALLTLDDPNQAPEGVTGWRAALAGRLVARFNELGSKPGPERAAKRERFAWLIHPDDLPAAPGGGKPAAEPAAELRWETDYEAAQWLLKNRYGRIVSALENLRKKPAAVPRLVDALNKRAIRPLSSWPERP